MDIFAERGTLGDISFFFFVFKKTFASEVDGGNVMSRVVLRTQKV